MELDAVGMADAGDIRYRLVQQLLREGAKRGAARFHVACADADGNVELLMQAGLHALRRGAHPVPGGRDARCPKPWSDDARRRLPDPPDDAARRAAARPAVRARDARARSPASRPSGCPTGSARATHWRVPRSSLTPILRFADVEGFVQASPDGGKDGTQLDGFLQIGVAKEDQPHYLKVIARPEADVADLIDFGLGRHRGAHDEGRRPSSRPRGHRPRANLRITDRPAPGGGRLRLDRQRHPADEGNPRPRRRAGPRAGRRPLRWRLSVGSDERPRESIDDLDALLASLPPEIVAAVHALPGSARR